MSKLRSLEMLRAVAALLVVLYHAQTIFTSPSGRAPFGGIFIGFNHGVDLFFVLSGFIIAYVHGDDLGRPGRLKNYLFNRISRIYPAVWIMTALALAMYCAGFGGADKAAKLDPASILASFLLLAQQGAPLVNVTWSLTYEIFFYGVFAIAIINRPVGLMLLVAWQVGTAVLALSNLDPGFYGYYFRTICLEFSIGLGCAWWLRRAGTPIHVAAWWVALAIGIGGLAAGMALSQAIGWPGLLSPLGSGLIILALVRLEQAGRINVPGFLQQLGGASYAIYIVHFSVITVLAAILAHLRVPVMDWLCLACAATGVVGGLMFDRLLDRPIQRWLRRRKPAILRIQTA